MKVKQVGNLYPDTEKFKNRTIGRVYDAGGISPTINCCGGGDREPKIIDDTYANRDVREYEEFAPTLRSERSGLKVSEHYRIRKLTPRECFRLMGLRDKEIDTIQSAGISNSQLYKLAGNSIVVDNLYHIFRTLFSDTKPQENTQLTLF